MRRGWLRAAIPLALLACAGVAFAAHLELGGFSAFGPGELALLCPLGALEAMVASGEPSVRALVSVAVALVGAVLVGRAFCAWACPVPLWSRLRALMVKVPLPARLRANSRRDSVRARAGGQPGARQEGAPSASRFIVLGAALASAAVFGFPVFCLVCPIGLTFALVFAVVAFAGGVDVGWALAAIPAVLVVETMLFRKWCSHICPVGALLSLAARLNRTLRPHVDRSRCVDSACGPTCGMCARSCPEGIDPREGAGAHLAECTRCCACSDACPAHALSFPLLAGSVPERAVDGCDAACPSRDASTAGGKAWGVPGDYTPADVVAALKRNGR